MASRLFGQGTLVYSVPFILKMTAVNRVPTNKLPYISAAVLLFLRCPSVQNKGGFVGRQIEELQCYHTKYICTRSYHDLEDY